MKSCDKVGNENEQYRLPCVLFNLYQVLKASVVLWKGGMTVAFGSKI